MSDEQFKLVSADEVDPSIYYIEKPIDGVEFTEYERGYNHAINDAHRLNQKAEDLSYLFYRGAPFGLNGEVIIIDKPRPAHWIITSDWAYYWDRKKGIPSKRIVNTIRCSNCRQGWSNNIDLFKSFNRCPNCGAEMNGKDEYR